MTTSSIIIGILFIICLTVPVATRSVGLIKADDKPSQKWFIPLLFGIYHGIFAMFGKFLGGLFAHLITYIAQYMVFAMMLIIAVKMFVDSMRILKGKMLYTVSNDTELMLLVFMSAMNTLLMSLMGPYFEPFGRWYMPLVIVASFLWSFITVRIEFTPGVLKKLSFTEFSASVFMLVIAVLYLFTDLI